ncbi:MerR family transcriptional regulator [Actinocatenispora rupis]|uniref:MerR family transcriptional regulator n=1 Tax=Actinocatenispora rupis TaxID=519421 RepID=UPI0019455252|nr:MerR family transcriptional regulator [Actinocatenispora rupis]
MLTPTRLPSGYRVYDEAHIDMVFRVRRLIAAGLNTATIATVLPCLYEDGPHLAPACPDVVAAARLRD